MPRPSKIRALALLGAALVFGAPSTKAATPAGSAVSVVEAVPPAGATVGYVQRELVVPQGGSLTLLNLDAQRHDLVELRSDDYNPRFGTTRRVQPFGTGDVRGVPDLPPGQYTFYCSFHPTMVGQLTVAAVLPVGEASQAMGQ